MFMILRLGLKNIDFLGKMKAEKFACTAVSGYVPNHERNHRYLKEGAYEFF
jgi:hypothetical protein